MSSIEQRVGTAEKQMPIQMAQSATHVRQNSALRHHTVIPNMTDAANTSYTNADRGK